MSLYKITHTSLVHAWNCCMSTLRHVSVQEDCSKHVAGQQKNSCRGTWCVCAEQRTICRQVNEVNVEDPPQPNVYYCYCYCYFSVTHLISVHVIMFVSASWRWHRCWEWSWRGYVIPVQDIETCRSIWRRSRLLIFRDCDSCKTISTCGYVCVCLWYTICHLLAISSCAKSYASQAFCVYLHNNWDSLPVNIGSSDSLASFKSSLKSHILSSACHVYHSQQRLRFDLWLLVLSKLIDMCIDYSQRRSQCLQRLYRVSPKNPPPP